MFTPKIRVLPIVVFNISDHYVRREQVQESVMGMLLGSKLADGVVEVRGTVPVPHHEREGEFSIDMEFQRQMYDLHLKVDPKNVIVGWYSTAWTEHSTAIHSLYEDRVKSPVHLLMDPTLKSGTMNIKMFEVCQLKSGSEEEGNEMMREVPFVWKASNAERLALDLMIEQTNEKAPALLEMKDKSPAKGTANLKELLESIKVVGSYIQRVKEGSVPEDKVLGRALYQALSAIPPVDSDAFARVFNNSLQDMLMVMYLAKLIKAQHSLAEKIFVATHAPEKKE